MDRPYDADDICPAEQIFASFVVRRARGEEASLEDLCVAHPELEGDLRRLHSAWSSIDGRVAREEDPAELLSQLVGADVDPLVAASQRELTTTLRERIAAASGGAPGRYCRLQLLGRGGMGDVWRVWDRHLRRQLALKTIRVPSGAVAPELLRRFLEEAQITAQLDHPGIVPVHELGLEDGGDVFYTMKLVEGRDLGEVLRAHGTPTDQRKLVGILRRVCEAMAFSHQRGVVHRDLKPSNVMVGRQGEVYVTDWGLALAPRGAKGDDPRLDPIVELHTATGELATRADQVLGTPSYMAPEQRRDPTRVDARTDVWSLGAILYEMLSGRHPSIEQRVSPRPLGAPRELAAIAARAMAQAPDDRYATAAELGDDLQAWLETRPVAAMGSSTGHRMRLWLRRHPAAAVAGALGLAAVLAVIAAAALWSRSEADRVRVDVLRATSKLALLGEDADPASLILARQAFASRPSPLTSVALHRVLQAQRLSRVLRSESDAYDPIYHLTFTADGSHLALGAQSGVAAIYRVPELDRVLRVEHESWARWVWMPADGSSLWTATEDGYLHRWSRTSGERLAEPLHLGGVPRAFSTSPNGTTCAGSGMDGPVRIWRGDGEELARLPDDRRAIWSDWSPDGRRLAVMHTDGWLRVAKRTGEVMWECQAHPPPTDWMEFYWVVFTDRGRSIATGGLDGTVRIWRVSNGRQRFQLKLPAPLDRITALAASPDGQAVAVGSILGTVVRWQPRRGIARTLHIDPNVDMAGNTNAALALAWSDDGSTLAAGFTDGRVRLWEGGKTEPMELPGHEHWVNGILFVPGSRLLASHSFDGDVRIWRTGGELRLVPCAATAYESPAAVIDGRNRIVIGGADGDLCARDLPENTIAWQTDQRRDPCLTVAHAGGHIAFRRKSGRAGIAEAATGREVLLLDSPVAAIELSADGASYAAVVANPAPAGGGARCAWGRIVQDRVIHISDPELTQVGALALSPAGELLALAGGQRVAVFDRAGTMVFATSDLPASDHGVLDVAFSSDSETLAVASADVRLLSAQDGRLLAELPHPPTYFEDGVRGVVFSPDGSTLLTFTNGGQGRLWRRNGEACTHVLLRGHDSWIMDGAFSPDGRRVATAGFDTTARLWDLDGASLAVLEHPGRVSSVQFADRGHLLITTCEDGAVRAWPASDARLLAVARNRIESLPPGASRGSGMHEDPVRGRGRELAPRENR